MLNICIIIIVIVIYKLFLSRREHFMPAPVNYLPKTEVKCISNCVRDCESYNKDNLGMPSCGLICKPKCMRYYNENKTHY